MWASKCINIFNYFLFYFKVNIGNVKTFLESNLAYQLSGEHACKAFILYYNQIS